MNNIEQHSVDSVLIDHNNLMVSIKSVPVTNTIRSKSTKRIAEKGINIANISQTSPVNGTYDLSFIVSETDHDAIREVLDELGKQYPELKLTINTDVSRLVVYGIGMRTQPGVTAKFLNALAENDIQILMMTTSEISISCIIHTKDSKKAEQAEKKAFDIQ